MTLRIALIEKLRRGLFVPRLDFLYKFYSTDINMDTLNYIFYLEFNEYILGP